MTVVVGCFDPVVACGLATILGGDRTLHVLATNVEHAALERAVTQQVPGVAILDETAARAVLRRLRSNCPATAIVVFAHNPPPAYGKLLLAAGATCVARSISPVALVAMLHLAAQGQRTFAPSDGERVERRYPSDAGLLTKRQRQVFVGLSRGQSYSRIAYKLQIGVRTVESHAAQVRDKLHVRDNRELLGMPVPHDWDCD